MFQLRYRDVSDPGEEPDLMVNEQQSGIVRREPLRVSFVFHTFILFAVFLCEVAERSSRSHHILNVDKTEIPCCLARHTELIYWKQMDLRHLRYFVAVAEEQNITRAALRLHVSQPPLSRQIRNLEDDLGIALFDREAKAVRLTEAGRVFLAEARIILQRAKEAVELAKDVAGGKRGEIHVGYAPSLTVELLPRALSYFRESNPAVRVQLHDFSTQEMLRGLRDGKLHAALLVQASPKTLSQRSE